MCGVPVVGAPGQPPDAIVDVHIASGACAKPRTRHANACIVPGCKQKLLVRSQDIAFVHADVPQIRLPHSHPQSKSLLKSLPKSLPHPQVDNTCAVCLQRVCISHRFPEAHACPGKPVKQPKSQAQAQAKGKGGKRNSGGGADDPAGPQAQAQAQPRRRQGLTNHPAQNDKCAVM